MDLGLQGRRAIVCGASRGLGYACAMSLAREGVALIVAARGQEALDKAVTSLRAETGAAVTGIATDVTTEAGRVALLSACPAPDILINNAGGPPPGDFRNWSRADWIAAVDNNMLSAIFLIRTVVDGMIERRFGRIVNITSSAVKAPIDILGLSNAARAGLTGFVAGLSRQVARQNVTINNLLPGAFLTNRLSTTLAKTAATTGQSVEQLMERRRNAIPAGRFGDPAEFGEACAFLCSMQAGYVTGQNFLIDGGAYPGTL